MNLNYSLGKKHIKSWIEHVNTWTDDNNNYQRTLRELKHKKPSEFIEENRQAIEENNYLEILQLVENVTQNLNNGFQRHIIQLRYDFEKFYGFIQTFNFEYIIRHMISNVYVLSTKYLNVHYEKLDRLFRIYKFVWFNFISEDQKIDIIKKIYENNTFMDYAFRILSLQDNINDNIETYKNQLEIHFRKYQQLVEELLRGYDFKQNIRSEVNTNLVWLPHSKYLEHIRARRTAPMFRR